MCGKMPSSMPTQEHGRELQALGRVQRHEHDLGRGVVVEIVGVGDEGDLLEELVDRVELARRPRPARRCSRADPSASTELSASQLGEVPVLVERGLQERGRAPSTMAPIVEQRDEALDATERPSRDTRLVGVAHRVHEARCPYARAQASSRPTLVSPMPRLGTLMTRLMLTSSDGLTIARRYAIASLISRAVVEPRAADDLVRDAASQQLPPRRHGSARWCGRRPRSPAHQRSPSSWSVCDRRPRPTGLVAFVVGVVAARSCRPAELGPQLLRLAVGLLAITALAASRMFCVRR